MRARFRAWCLRYANVQALSSMPLLHLLPSKELDPSSGEAMSGPLSPHLQHVLLIRLCEVCGSVLQWLEQAATSTLGPTQRPLRSPLDMVPPELSPSSRVRASKKVQLGRARKVCGPYGRCGCHCWACNCCCCCRWGVGG